MTENRKYFEMNDNENRTYQNSWDIAKARIRGKCIALNAYIRNEERLKINDLTSFHLKKLKEQPINSKESTKREIKNRKYTIKKIN